MAVSRKIFVGSLPDGMDGGPLSAEYSKYGVVEEIFLKPGCEPGRQWAFVTFNNPQEASDAVDLTNGVLMFPGSLRPCEVSLARNQGMFGEGSVSGTTGRAAVSSPAPVPVAGPRKVFVGTLPDGVTESLLRTEFSKFGQVVDVYLKPNCEPGRQWGFITFGNPDEARFVKESCDRILVLPGANQPCEVTLAKNQGLYGQSSIDSSSQSQSSFGSAGSYGAPQGMESMDGPSKIFVGSLPTGCNEHMIRAEYSKFGQVTDVFIKPNCEQGRQWAFVTFVSQQQAQNAKNATDRVLRFPGSEKTCEVMLAKNQGKFGQQPLNAHSGGLAAGGPMPSYGNGGMGGGYSANQPPPPSTPPPAHVTPWKMYKTESGLPYYHNAQTGATTWDCPQDLQGLSAYGGHAASPSGGQQGCGGWGQQGCGGGGGAYGGGGCGGCCGGCGGGCQQHGCAAGCGGHYVNQGGQGGCGGHCGGGCGCGGCGARYSPY